MIQQTFQHRSGRVISLSRLVLAAAFPVGIWLDPSQPLRHPEFGYPMLASYLVAAFVFLLVTWNDWRLETRLALPALIVDLALFAALVFLTEGYANPFFPIFVFIIMSAALRWGWRETAVTAAVLIVLFFAASAAGLIWDAADFSARRFFFRSIFLVVLSFILIWFGLNQLRPRMPRFEQSRLSDPSSAAPPVREVAAFVAAYTGAKRVILAWWSNEEPGTDVVFLEDGRFGEARHGPDVFGPLVDGKLKGDAFLFDVDHGWILRCDGRRRHLLALATTLESKFIEHYRLTSGLAVPVASSGYGGVIFALDVPGLCSDDIAQGESLGEEISAAFERASAMALLEEAASVRVRLSLSRDLHDSVLQLLAGTTFRLEGVKRSVLKGGNIDEEISILQTDLVAEQRDLRALIEQLRGRGPDCTADLHQGLRDLAARMSRQWDVACSIDHCPPGLETSALLERDCHQLIREAVANAVRHGKASNVAIRVDSNDDAMELVVTDDGSGFPGDGHFATERGGKAPWSLSERVRALGGHMALVSSTAGSQITISLPIGRAA
ncbi:histidine kinase [Sphingosinicella sp. LHD-64]|uniref:sensor histidine kinase n=1 Tax=Sphingosinicella sp. LHD-64 TaxID=3072139 RepID=UPI00280E137B|nr:ATP-binding protein [Sphingosinicella sp. LHD-64]MDQ8755891.1 histidine kinase [Sphingosinicella sp. LHD-64]